MKFTCNRNDLIEGISKVQRAVSFRSTIPILESILIETEKDNILLTGYDMEMGIQFSLCGDISDSGKVAIPSKIFGDIVRRMSGEQITFTVNENYAVKIESDKSVYEIKAYNAETYPELPKYEPENEIHLGQHDLKQIIRKSMYSASLDETRPALNGCCFKSSGNSVEMVGIDGFRVGIGSFTSDTELPSMKFIIPNKSIKDLYSMLEDNGEIALIYNKKQLVFEFGNTHFISRLIPDEYMKYESIIPQSSMSQMKVGVKDFLDSVERSTLMIGPDDRRYPITLKASGDGVLQIKTKTNIGSFNEDINISFSGSEIDIDFNPKFLIDALKVIDDEEVEVSFNGPSGPCVMKPVEGNSFLSLILPVKK